MPPEIAEWLAARVASFELEAKEGQRFYIPAVAATGALPIYYDWTNTIGLRPDGRLIFLEKDEELFPFPECDLKHWLLVVVEASKTQKELKMLVPDRPPEAVDCHHPPHPMFTEGKVICPDCVGLNWLPLPELSPPHGFFLE